MTDTKLIDRGVPTEHTNMVSADQLTVLGNGTTEKPLRAAGTGTIFLADFVPTGDDILVGRVASVSFDEPTETAVSVTFSFDTAVGIIIAVNDAPTLASPIVTVKGSGVVTLSEDKWKLVTGGVGLVQGQVYYLAGSGNLTAVKPTEVGGFIAQVGVAINTTMLRLSTPVVPIQIVP